MQRVASGSQLQQAISTGQVVVVACTASWCGPCKQLKPQLPGLASQYPNATWLSLDCSESNPIAAQYNVTGLPTVIVFAGGREFGRITGNRPQEISTTVQRALGGVGGAPAPRAAMAGSACGVGGGSCGYARPAQPCCNRGANYRCETRTDACGGKSTTCHATGCG